MGLHREDLTRGVLSKETHLESPRGEHFIRNWNLPTPQNVVAYVLLSFPAPQNVVEYLLLSFPAPPDVAEHVHLSSPASLPDGRQQNSTHTSSDHACIQLNSAQIISYHRVNQRRSTLKSSAAARKRVNNSFHWCSIIISIACQ